MTPLLFPVVPEVNMMVARSSGFGSYEHAPSWVFRSCPKDSASPSFAVFCMEMTDFSFGHFAFAASITSLRISSTTSTAASDRSMSSHISSSGRDTSRGTHTFPLFTVPRYVTSQG